MRDVGKLPLRLASIESSVVNLIFFPRDVQWRCATHIHSLHELGAYPTLPLPLWIILNSLLSECFFKIISLFAGESQVRAILYFAGLASREMKLRFQLTLNFVRISIAWIQSHIWSASTFVDTCTGVLGFIPGGFYVLHYARLLILENVLI